MTHCTDVCEIVMDILMLSGFDIKPDDEDHDDVIEALGKYIQQHKNLIDACDLVQRAHCGDGIDMATAVDACLLALSKPVK